MKILGFGNASGSRYWRIEDPFKYLAKRGHEVYVEPSTRCKSELLAWADVIVLNSIGSPEMFEMIDDFRKSKGLAMVWDVDDWREVNDDNPSAKQHEVRGFSGIYDEGLRMADVVTCTTPYFKNKLKSYNKHIFVLPNSMDMDRWDVSATRVPNKRVRVRLGWCGSVTHMNDMRNIAPAVDKVVNEGYADFFVMGDPRMGELFNCKVEVMHGVPFEAYPSKLKSLNLDVAIAPLDDTPFNRCKSNIKFLEYTIAGAAGVYSPTVYNFRDFDMKFGLIADTQEQWYCHIRNLCRVRALREELLEAAQSYVHATYDLKKNSKLWEKTYELAIRIASSKIDTKTAKG